jgi:hypothetical protein
MTRTRMVFLAVLFGVATLLLCAAPTTGKS